ncbi:hypothetical protein O181_078874 [Austropuccinia psidii MF-1]|uniref:Helicase C-terminal domain-containing protein n=1 Tax=Austropuccinia psidii MF-1 TaxID=1389203 RepID=A0A9Q3FHC5_9BASI|nr:hypothetical protein [Austropuccinia psidii MF-1]
MADADLEDQQGRRTQDNSWTITQTIVDVETCMMSSKIAHLLELLLKNKQSKYCPTKLVVYTQCTPFLDLIGIALAHHSILSIQIVGTITARAQEKALEEFFNNIEFGVLIASIATAGTGLNISCASIVYLMEPNWNPGIKSQAVDHLHHIGQQQPVKVIYYITLHSVEDNMGKVPFKLVFVPDCITILKYFLWESHIPITNRSKKRKTH